VPVPSAALADHTTLRLGGPARRLVEATSAAEIVAAVSRADAAGEPILLVGGGSNLVVADEGFDGVAILLRSRGVRVEGGGRLTAEAGERWDDLVAHAVAEGWAGIECLAGIPGLTGATPVQNVGAYGQDVAQTITGVRVWDRHQGRAYDMAAGECRFGYRDSAFKHTDRYVVLSVTFRLQPQPLSMPIAYAELAGLLGVRQGEQAKLADVRDAVLALRRGKGMVLDPADHDTWSAGSFFTNPVLDAAELARFESQLGRRTDYPHWPEGEKTKLPAAWLIQHAGFEKGYGTGPVGVSTKHTLALTNRGGATTADLLALADEIRATVRDRFGVTLQPEPRLVGVGLS
jgi:UDP-N-acetylmuramate dehydrogenase